MTAETDRPCTTCDIKESTITMSVAVEGFRPSMQSFYDQIGVSAHAWSMA